MTDSISSIKYRLPITLEDVAKEAGVTMHMIYSDIKRGKLTKEKLSSIVDYVNNHKQQLQQKSFNI
jgi:uncharacterized protein (UPF0264 family)